jgi:hypothetical protein
VNSEVAREASGALKNLAAEARSGDEPAAAGACLSGFPTLGRFITLLAQASCAKR